MKRDTENTLLLLIGVSVAMIAITGSYTRYVKPGLLPWLAATAVLLVGLAAAAVIRDVRRGRSVNDPHDEHDHGDHHHRPGAAWLLVIPVILLIFISPPPLSARAAAPRPITVATNAPRMAFQQLPRGRAPDVPLPEVLMRIAADSSDTLDGRLITVKGFTMKDGEHTDLARIVIICCAADAQLARLRLTGPAAAQAAELPENTWVSVEGKVPADQQYRGPSSVPVIEASALTRTDPPKNTY